MSSWILQTSAQLFFTCWNMKFSQHGFSVRLSSPLSWCCDQIGQNQHWVFCHLWWYTVSFPGHILSYPPQYARRILIITEQWFVRPRQSIGRNQRQDNDKNRKDNDMITASCFCKKPGLHKYLAIYFQVFAYEEPQINADKRRCLSAADPSAFIRVHPRSVKAVFPGKNPGKLLAGYL